LADGLTGPGRPLRALGLLGLTGGAWLASQVPDMATHYDAAMAGLQVPPHHDALPVTPPPMPGAPAGIALVATGNMAPAIPRPSVLRRPVPSPVLPAALAGPPSAAAPIAGPSPAPATTVAPAIPGFDLAASAYAQLALGNRRAADALFTAALAAADDGAPQARDWARAQRQLHRRWSGDAYALFRDSGLSGPTASPVLGGGQSGASLSYNLDPLARRSLSVFGRIYAAHDAGNGIDPDTAQAAIGVRWQLRPGVSIAAERLIAIGSATSSDWNLRVAAGGERRVGRVSIDGYGEAGARGNGDVYAGGQAHARLALGNLGPARLAAGPGVWGSVQSAAPVVARVDIGAGITARLPAGLAVNGDWRWRVAGNAAPGSGPAVTVALAF
jgi:hypothetical protein